MRYYGRESFAPFEDSLKSEWLAVNGLGGYASLSLTGARSRYYHGLLVASLAPPVERYLLLASLRDEVVLKDRKRPLWTARFRKRDEIRGLAFLHSLTLDPVPEYRYLIGGDFLIKTILPVYGSNAVQIAYRWEGETPLTLETTPLCTFRDYHGLEKRVRPGIAFVDSGDGFSVVHEELGAYSVTMEGGVFQSFPRPLWERDLLYLKERERGFKGREELALPGVFRFVLEKDKPVVITARYGEGQTPAFPEALQEEIRRQEGIHASCGSEDPLTRRLSLAADKFLVKRKSTATWSLLAGFPWFSDWGRDTMISLPGIALATGRHDVARDLLETFAASESEGLLPNRFSDYEGDQAEYNTVDASLWFFIGVLQYFRQTGDAKTVRERFFPVMDRIISKHIEGTRFNIKMDPEDGLLQAGEHGIQLTWMDAKVDGLVITPRHGKPVEIAALWYNALCIRDELASALESGASRHAALAEKILNNFRKQFWNEEVGALFDVITDGEPDPAIRPNQLFAICLPYPLLEDAEAKRVFETVTRHLLTPYGLRSLSPEDPSFQPVFAGGRFARDSAYHQGTVWSWLIGPYVFSYFNLFGDSAETREKIVQLLQPLFLHLDRDGLDCISENFDGLFPAEGKGCFHQAWSVAELLRILKFITAKKS